MKKHIIYKAQNMLTDEVYIGATKGSIEQRKLDHLERVGRGESNKFQEAIGTYGPEAFSWTQIDTANSIDELAQKEKQYIIEYNAKDEGYNSDSGGGFKKTVYQFDVKTGEILNSFESLESAGKAVKASRKSINNVCLGVNKTCKGYFWSYVQEVTFDKLVDSRKKKVIQLDLNNSFIAEFDSVAEAYKKTGVSKTCISRVCRGERKNSSGYIWKYQ